MSRAALTRRRFTTGLVLGAAGVGGLAGFGGGKEHASMQPESEADRPSRGKAGKRQPVGFVAHGAPTLATDPLRGEPLGRWGESLPQPSGILVVSAHWEQSPPQLSASEPTELVYDFSGFPPELYRLRYDTPPATALAGEVTRTLAPRWQPRSTGRGLDHGAWVPLLHLYPRAEIPVLQLSMPSAAGPRALFELGQALAPLRDSGVLLLGSGNLVHNLRRIDWKEASPPPAWAAEFDSWVAGALERRAWDELVDYRNKAPSLAEAHPTHDHFLPLLVCLGAAEHDRARFPFTGWEYGSISRRMVELA
jgi:4,5-DOPA dioxygenase extradiol